MVSLSGASTNYMPLDDSPLVEGTPAKVMTVNDVRVYGDEYITPLHDLFVGRNIASNLGASKNTVIGENVYIAPGVQNSTSIGRRNAALMESNKFYLGDFLVYNSVKRQIALLNDALVATRDGAVQIGGPNGLRIERTQKDAGTVFNNQIGLRDPDTNAKWSMALQASENAPEGTDAATQAIQDSMRDLVLRSDNGAAIVFSDTYVPSITNFTGQHRCIMRDDPTCLVGSVVVSTGEYMSLDGKELTVDEAIPVVTRSTSCCDTRVFGVLSRIEEAGSMRRVCVGNIAFERPKDFDERRAIVNGSGEGGILVCGQNGNVTNGDFLCTSALPGLAMRQNEPYKCRHTCGKATTSVDFEGAMSEPVMIGCVYA